MVIKNMPKEELEIMSYADLAELILAEEQKTLNTAQIFKKICELLDYTEEDYSNNIGDFYTSLSTDKRFVFMSNNEWNLREKHPIDITLDEDDDEEIEELEETETEEENFEENNENIDEDMDDDLDNLSVLDEDELDED